MATSEILKTIDTDIEKALITVQDLINGFFSILPKLAIALIVFTLVWIIGHFVSYLIKRSFRGRRKNLGKALSRLTMMGFLLGGSVLSVAIVAPSVGAAELFQLLGVGSIAIGFAFRDILQNFLAGPLILFRQPYQEGDTVIYQDVEGIIESIEPRATYLRKYDGNRMIIPNGQIFTNPIVVVTADPDTRSQYDFGISYEADIDQAIQIIKEKINTIEGVLQKPAIDVGVHDLSASAVNIRARWWTDAKNRYKVHTEALRKVKLALDQANIGMPYPQRTLEIPALDEYMKTQNDSVQKENA